MNLTNFDRFKLAEDARISKIRIHNFYSRIISKYFNRQLISNREEIINSEKEGKNFKTDVLTYQFYFLFSFGVQDTLLSARKFYASVLYQTQFIRKLLVENPINLLCLESEALPTVIGVCEVIDEIISNKSAYIKSSSNVLFRIVRILVIDTRQNWRRLCKYIVDAFNKYFKIIRLQLDFADDITSIENSFSSRKLIDFDLVIVARIFTERRTFSQNYSSIQIVLNGIKVHAVLFYFDSCNKKYYEDLKRLVSETLSFSQVSNQILSFQDLCNKQEYFDLCYWDSDFHPVIFSTWIKDYGVKTFFEKLSNLNASNQLNSKNRPKNYCNKKVTTLRNDISDTKNSTKTVENSNSGNDFLTSTQTNISKTTKASDIANQSVSRSGQANVVKRKQKLKSPTKHCYPAVSAIATTQANVSKTENKTHTSIISDVSNSELTVLDKQINDSKTNKFSQKYQCLKIAFDATISQNAISEVKSQVSSSKDLGSENSVLPSTQTILPKRKTKKSNPKVPNVSAEKMVIPNKEDKTLLSKQKGNISPSEMKANVPKRKKKGKSSAKSRKNKSDPESRVPKEICNTKSKKKKKSLPFIFTKTIITKNGAEELKLIGKLARMEEERKTSCKTVITKTADQKLSHPKKYKYLDRKRKSNGEFVKRNKVVEQFVIKRLQIKPKYSKTKQMPNAETVETSKALQKLCSTNQQNMNDYKCPHLRTEESVSNYAEFLSEIYYFKHFKKGKYFNDKIKDIPKNLILYKYKKQDINYNNNNTVLKPSYRKEQIILLKYTKFHDDQIIQ